VEAKKSHCRQLVALCRIAVEYAMIALRASIWEGTDSMVMTLGPGDL
jgi:hypothetical protein